MKQILEKIKEYNRIIIHGHQRPDGDCIGSQYGLYHLLKESFPNKEIYVTGEASEFVGFLGKPSLIEESLFQGALSICVDCATSERLSDTRIDLADYSIKIDHHIPVDHYGDYQYVDTSSPACAQIITEFYLEFKSELKLNKDAAMALYTGIVTDTGRFRFDNVTSKTFNIAGILIDAGADLAYIDNQLSVEDINNLYLKGYVLSNFKVTENGFAYIVMKEETVAKFGVSKEDAAAQVSTIGSIDFCPVWALFMEYPDEIRIRLRSRGPVINLLAEEYEGGGHAKASGAKLKEWSNLDEFVKKADLLVKDYKNQII